MPFEYGLRPFETTKLPKFESNLEKLNCLPSLVQPCSKLQITPDTRLKAYMFRINVLNYLTVVKGKGH